MENQDILKLLCARNYYVQVNVCVYQTWEHIKSFSCLKNPKQNDLLLFVNNLNATYTMNDGESFSLKHGDIVFIPTGKEYILNINDRKESGCTYGINFLLFDENHNRVILKNNEIVSDVNTKGLVKIFQEMSLLSDAGTRFYAKLQALFYDIIVQLSTSEKQRDLKNFSVIEKGIEYLESDTMLLKSVSQIAKMCNVSHNYFCRLFKEYSGLTPEDYILRAKLEKAKIILKETSLSVSETAYKCGFQDASYFCRIFKRKTGLSPLKYRKSKT